MEIWNILYVSDLKVSRHDVTLTFLLIVVSCWRIVFGKFPHWLNVRDIPHRLIDVDFSDNTKDVPAVFKSQPHQEVPLLVDGEIIVYEGQAIMRYLASTYTDFSGYGLTLQSRFICESIISWASSELHRAVGYSYTYPQFLDGYKLESEKANEQLVESGLAAVSHHLEILEKGYLAKSRFLTGDRVTVADSYVTTILLQLEWTGFKFKLWPKVEIWLSRVKHQEYWDIVHATHKDFIDEIKRAAYVMD